MKKATKEGILIARYISSFLNEYVPSQKTDSINTLRSYQYALVLYMTFLEAEKGICCEDLCGQCYNRINIEEWLTWLVNIRKCTPDSCNNRLAFSQDFLEISWESGTCLFIPLSGSL